MALKRVFKKFSLLASSVVLVGCAPSIEDFESQIQGSWKVAHDGRETCTQFNSDKSVIFSVGQLEPGNPAAASQVAEEGRWWFERGGRLWTETAADRGLADESLNTQRLGYYIKRIDSKSYTYISMQSDRPFEALRVESCD